MQFHPLYAMGTQMSDDQEPKSTPTGDQPPPKAGIKLAPDVRVREQDIHIAFVRSSGPGGQNVNKRATKAQLRVALDAIPLDERAMKRLRHLAANAVNNDDELLIEADETRSQSRNRKAAIDRLRELVARAAVKPKTRKATKPSKGSVRRRLDEKTRRGQTKRLRKPPREGE